MHPRVRRGGAAWPLCLVAGLIGAAGLGFPWPLAAGAQPPPPVQRRALAEAFFNSSHIPHFVIEVSGTNLAQLQQNDRRDVRAMVRVDGIAFEDVGLHVKGAAGSRRRFDDDKPALTLNFDRFKPGQHFHGLDKLSLNNSVQDPSYLTEHLCSELFREAGVPSPRVAFARVTVNGRDAGLYVLKEGFDKEFLRRWFRSPNGNLYDGGFIRDITDPLERTSGEGANTRADLKALAAAAMLPDLDLRRHELERLLDLDRFLSFLALEIMTWHWDGYALKRNNYRIYHDPSTDRMVFLPHGMDQMFWDSNGPIEPGMEGLVARAVMEIPALRARYRERVGTLLTNVFRIQVLTNRINALQARLRPVLASYHPQWARDHDGAVEHLRRQVTARVLNLHRLVSEPPPERLQFDAGGVAPLTRWYPLDIFGGNQFGRETHEGVPTLFIRVERGDDPRSNPSWRCRVLLGRGRYRLSGRVRTENVAPRPEQPAERKGYGAGLRISGISTPRANRLIGTTDWTPVEYEFVIQDEGREVVLVCELRANAGVARFDLASLKLRRLRDETP